jgi:hypothetical protein
MLPSRIHRKRSFTIRVERRIQIIEEEEEACEDTVACTFDPEMKCRPKIFSTCFSVEACQEEWVVACTVDPVGCTFIPILVVEA